MSLQRINIAFMEGYMAAIRMLIEQAEGMAKDKKAKVVKDAIIADLQKKNATIANNAVIMNRKIDILEEDKKRLESKYLDMLEEAENDDCELYHIKADQVLCDLLNELGFGALVERYDSKSKWYA